MSITVATGCNRFVCGVRLFRGLQGKQRTIAHYLGFYPVRVLSQLGRSAWHPGPDLEVPKGSGGVTVVARCRPDVPGGGSLGPAFSTTP